MLRVASYCHVRKAPTALSILTAEARIAQAAAFKKNESISTQRPKASKGNRPQSSSSTNSAWNGIARKSHAKKKIGSHICFRQFHKNKEDNLQMLMHHAAYNPRYQWAGSRCEKAISKAIAWIQCFCALRRHTFSTVRKRASEREREREKNKQFLLKARRRGGKCWKCTESNFCFIPMRT